MKSTISHFSYAQGENSRDDPHSIADNQCQELVNCYPGDPNPTPREGNYLFNTQSWPGKPIKLIPWHDDINGHKVIGIIDKSIYWMKSGADAPVLIGDSNIFPSGDLIFSNFRVLNSLYIITDAEGYNFIIEWSGVTFLIRKANIDRPTFTSSTNPTNGAGALTSSKHYGYAVTFVNRNDQSIPEETTVYSAGVLESVEDTADRFFVTMGGADDTVEITLNIIDTPDPQITHIRFYRTNANDSQLEASGDIFRFLVDIPMTGINAPAGVFPKNYTYTDITADDELAGSLNIIDDLVGKSPMPAGSSAYFHNGRMWIGGVNTTDNRGKWYYSDVKSSTSLRELSYFLFSSYIDTSLDNSEKNVGIGISQNDLIFVMEKTVWYLRDGDPSLFSRQIISSSRGSRFPNSFIEINKQLFYLSNEGPAAVYGRDIQLVESFAMNEIWPSTYSGIGLFHKLGVSGLGYEDNNPKNVLGFYYKNTYFLAWKDKVVGFYISPDNKSNGGWRVEFGSSLLNIGSIAVFNDDIAVFSPKANIDYGSGGLVLNPETGNYEEEVVDKRAWRFLWSGVFTDNLVVYELRSRSKAYYAGGSKRDSFGEALDLVIYSSFTDPGELRVNVITDFSRYTNSFKYTQESKLTALQNQDISADTVKTYWRRHQQQCLPEGIYGQTFEVKWRKNFLAPFDFYMKGFDLNFIQRRGQQYEFVSVTDAEVDNDEVLDEGLLAYYQPQQLSGEFSLDISSSMNVGNLDSVFNNDPLAFGISVWLKTDNISLLSSVDIFKANSVSFASSIKVTLTNTTITMKVIDASLNESSFVWPLVLANNTWTLFCIDFNSDAPSAILTANGYKNTVLVTKNSSSDSAVVPIGSLGSYSYSINTNSHLFIDNFRIYTGVFDSAELTDIYGEGV